MERLAQIVPDLSEPTRSLKEMVPDVWSAFAELHSAAVADGAVDGPRAWEAYREFAAPRMARVVEAR